MKKQEQGKDFLKKLKKGVDISAGAWYYNKAVARDDKAETKNFKKVENNA